MKKANVIYPNTFKGSASQHAGRALNETGWSVGVVEVSGDITMTIENHISPYENLRRIAREFEGELNFRIEHNGREITGRYVDILVRIGEWRGREVEFGKDLDGIRRVEKQDVVTALLGLGPEKEDGTRLEVLVEDEDALQRWGRIDRNGKLHHLIEAYEIESERIEMTEVEARRYTRTALDKRINTQITYDTSVIDLEQIKGLEHEKLRFGDTIRIKDTHFNPPLFVEARVFEQTRSIVGNDKIDIKLGDYVEYTEEEVNSLWEELRKEIQDRLARLVISTIVSDGGDVFKNGEGVTNLIAKTFVNGTEVDEDGTKYAYQWIKFYKDGNQVNGFVELGKSIHVKASDIDEKATYRVLIAYGLDVVTTAEFTVSNVYDGEAGKDGKSNYIHIRYSANSDGSNMNSSPDNAAYIGVVTTESPIAPTNYQLYDWSLIKGTDGVGTPGEDGKTSYVHIKYSNDGGSTFTSNNGEDPGDYIGTYTDFTEADSNDVSKYTWAKVKGDKGDKGDVGPRGAQGLQGPSGEDGIPGKPGEDGKTSYTHIAYADTASGGGFSQNPSDKKYIGMYVDFTQADSSDPTKYKWSLIKGADGTQGVPGPKGDNGRTPYFHTAWANNSTGTSGFSTTVSENKIYIGTYTDFTSADSTDPSKYSWTKIKGDKGEPGERGLQGLQGPEGKQGVPGAKGADGKTSYTHIAYADTASGGGFSQSPTNKKYIGMYVDFSSEDSTNPSSYKWSLIKGADGAQGVPGKAGADGRTPYFHTAWANNQTGTSGFSTTVSENKLFIGTYTDFTQADSSDPSKYSWTRIKGDKGDKGDTGARGPQGIQGPAGANGTSQYVHIRYSANANGNPMTVNPVANTAYIGLVNSTSSGAPGSYTAYTWSRYRGENGNQGIQGPAGKDGQTTYTWVKYADNAQGGGMSDSPDGKLYIGLAFNKTTPTESNVASQYTWSLMPQNIEIGGRNLILGSATPYTYAVASNDFNYWIAYRGLERNTTYTFSAKVEVLQGSVDLVSLYPYVQSGQSMARTEMPIVNGEIKGTFTTDGRYDYNLLIYNGETGSTLGNQIRLIEYQLEKGNIATDWQPAPEDVDESIQKAQTTADGKNSIFRQNTQPSTAGRKVGDVWFQTNADNKMYTFNGTSWVAAQFGEQAIVADSITANHIKSLVGLNVNNQFKVDSNGNVSFGGSLTGASGKFGDVSVEDGDFFLIDSKSNSKYTATPKNNLVADHSFEFLRIVGNAPPSGQPGMTTLFTESAWINIGNPSILTYSSGGGTSTYYPMFDDISIVLNSVNSVWQALTRSLQKGKTYTVSAHHMGVLNSSGGITMEIKVYNTAGTNTNNFTKTFDSTLNVVKRDSFTFTVPNINILSIELRIRGKNTNWIAVDGVQVVEGNYPSIYEPEGSLAGLSRGELTLNTASALFMETNSLNSYATGRHLYLRPKGEVRATNYGTTDEYITFRVGEVRFGTGSGYVEGYANGVRINGGGGDNVFIRSDYMGSLLAYNRTYTYAANAYVNSSGIFGRSTSSRRRKLYEKNIELEHAEKLLSIDAKTWFDKQICEDYSKSLSEDSLEEFQEVYGTEKIRRLPGVMAEDVHDLGLTEFVEYDEEGRPDAISGNLWVLLIPLVKNLYNELEEIKNGRS